MTQAVLRCPDANFKYEGWWFETIERVVLSGDLRLDSGVEWTVVCTERFERRDSDGATARVWEVRRA